ncbi:unnamed protein product [Polarella glacialis]|uniref:N-acetyltransferase domain-containing protein n=1 Tax=Polarella glacialis TaxID=89957 RepID=A0A813H9Z7_POLGL|nr:unnamed protein product [Polarella glacialis]
MATALAAQLRVPAEKLSAFAEVYEALGARGAERWEELLRKVRSTAEVEQRIVQRPDLLQGGAFEKARTDEMKMLSNAKDRLVFCGRYSAKVGTALDAALDSASAGLKAAAETAAKLGGGELKVVLAHASFGDEHAACRIEAFPYRPSVSAGHGTAVIEARTAERTAAAMAGTLLGYVAMQGNYIDTIEVFNAYSGLGVATALLAGAAAVEVAQGGAELCLDVRAANTPALAMYKKLGFSFGALQHPGFLDWDGGYEGRAEASAVKAKLPSHADCSQLVR